MRSHLVILLLLVVGCGEQNEELVPGGSSVERQTNEKPSAHNKRNGRVAETQERYGGMRAILGEEETKNLIRRARIRQSTRARTIEIKQATELKAFQQGLTLSAAELARRNREEGTDFKKIGPEIRRVNDRLAGAYGVDRGLSSVGGLAPRLVAGGPEMYTGEGLLAPTGTLMLRENFDKMQEEFFDLITSLPAKYAALEGGGSVTQPADPIAFVQAAADRLLVSELAGKYGLDLTPAGRDGYRRLRETLTGIIKVSIFEGAQDQSDKLLGLIEHERETQRGILRKDLMDRGRTELPIMSAGQTLEDIIAQDFAIQLERLIANVAERTKGE